MIEEQVDVVPKSGVLPHKKGLPIDIVPLQGASAPLPRHQTLNAEFDRVTGGGLVPGSILLVGGDPGIGKSTLLLQITHALAEKLPCLYISGEEGIEQIRLRATRLQLMNNKTELAAATNMRRIAATLEKQPHPTFVVIDSIQTMYLDTLDAAPGTVTQVRASAQELIRLAKKHHHIIVIVGHVTKEGTIAGPRVLEHMVDAVLYFEGERGHQFRIMRAVKNRFGATDEIGVFEMTELGLQEVANPSSLFLSEAQQDVSGRVVFAGLEGTRPILLEVQSLVAPSPLATPRRTTVGWDQNRLAMILAVLEARCGLSFVGKDVFLNVTGGFKIMEPAADLAVATSLISSLFNRSVPAGMIVFGEIGLSGEIRMVSQTELRLKEAAKLGFQEAILPQTSRMPKIPKTLMTHAVKHIHDLLNVLNMTGEA